MRDPVRALFGKRFSGEPDDFHGADDAARIFFVNFFVSRRIAFAQLFQQLFQRRGFECGAQFCVGGRRFTQAVKKSFEVKSGAATENRHKSA